MVGDTSIPVGESDVPDGDVREWRPSVGRNASAGIGAINGKPIPIEDDITRLDLDAVRTSAVGNILCEYVGAGLGNGGTAANRCLGASNADRAGQSAQPAACKHEDDDEGEDAEVVTMRSLSFAEYFNEHSV